MTDGYEELANAIVIRAAEDYIESKKKLKKDFTDTNAMAMLHETYRFFQLDWYKCLTTVDADIIIEHLKGEKI